MIFCYIVTSFARIKFFADFAFQLAAPRYVFAAVAFNKSIGSHHVFTVCVFGWKIFKVYHIAIVV